MNVQREDCSRSVVKRRWWVPLSRTLFPNIFRKPSDPDRETERLRYLTVAPRLRPDSTKPGCPIRSAIDLMRSNPAAVWY